MKNSQVLRCDRCDLFMKSITITKTEGGKIPDALHSIHLIDPLHFLLFCFYFDLTPEHETVSNCAKR